MSRSYKKPWHTQGAGKKARQQSKRSASRAARHEEELASGNAYRKAYNPWDIVDWKIYDPKNKKVSRK